MMVPIYEIEENLETGPVMNPGVVPSLNPDSSITETIEAFLAARIPNGKTARGYRRNLLAAFGSMCIERPSEIQTLHLVNWLGELNRDGRGDSSHAAALIAVRSFLKWAGAMGGHDIRNDLVQYLLPVPNVQVLKPHNSLTEKEVGKFLAAGKRGGPRDFALICVALGAGLRVSELVAVDVKDILDDAGGGTVIHVRQGKGKKDRMMPVRKEVRKAMDAYLDASGRTLRDGGPLFMSQDRAMGCRDSWRLSTKTATQIIKRAVELAGIEKRVSPHALRHTFAFASYLYSHNIVAVQHLLGHATVATTMRYVAHLDKLQLRSAIPAFLGGGKGPRVKPSVKK
jgi:site-specific recombinase XerD